jgi:hypothetical protein
MNRYAEFIENMNNFRPMQNIYNDIEKVAYPVRENYYTIRILMITRSIHGDINSVKNKVTYDMQTAFEWLYTTK